MRYKNGDKEALNILINLNLRLVVNVASRYKQKCFNTSLDSMERYKYELMSKNGREPQVCDYENDLNIPRNLIESIRFENYKLVSLDHTIGEFDQIPFSDIVMDTNFDFYDIDNYLDGKEILLHMKAYLSRCTYNIILMKLGIKSGKYGSSSEMSYKLIGTSMDCQEK